jgi:hypothetical protein
LKYKSDLTAFLRGIEQPVADNQSNDTEKHHEAAHENKDTDNLLVTVGDIHKRI